MTKGTLKKAQWEAVRFLNRIVDLEAQIKNGNSTYIRSCKESGAVKRASMDLTRALAVMRRP